MKKHYRQSELDENQPNHYKWSFIYFNSADHRVIVPKRVAWMGWTFNFASPFTYLIIMGIVGLLVLLDYFFNI
jgi:uncharacterized membrane protein